MICGEVDGITGPVSDIIAGPEYLDVTVLPGRSWTHPTKPGDTVFAYLFEGSACFGPEDAETVCAEHGTVVLLGDGDEVALRAGKDSARFLLISGKPIGEPIAWGGPIVMNTREELERAFDEYRHGTFVKVGSHPKE